MAEPPVTNDPQPAGSGKGRDSLLQVGSVLAGRYRILQRLGEGAMGSVYLAEHLRIGRKDAIKVLRDSLAGDSEAMARFVRGARSVSRIRHENVCTIYDFSDTEDGVQFLAMEYIPGSTLRDVLVEAGTFSLERVVAITLQASGALQAAHDAGIVHRDLKPANIMLMSARDGSDIVKVVDFDIAKAEDDGGESEVTRMGFVVGTPEYMSPEQLTGETLDGRSDVYSLALVVFRMLTGLLPFQVDNTREMLVSRLTQTPLPLAQAMPGRTFPPGVQQALDWALQRDRENRAPTTIAFARALAEGAGIPMGAPLSGAASGSNVGTPRPPAPVSAGEIPATRMMDPSRRGSGRVSTERQGWNRMVVAAAAVLVLGAAGVGAWVATRDRGVPADQTNATNPVLPLSDSSDRAALAHNNQASVDDSLKQGTRANQQSAPERTPPDAGTATRDPVPPRRDPPIADQPGTARVPVTPQLQLADADGAIARQFASTLRMGASGTAEKDVLEAVRDTAFAGYHQSASPVQQMRAAYVLGVVLFHLKLYDDGLPWAQTALKLCETRCDSYANLVDSYHRVGR